MKLVHITWRDSFGCGAEWQRMDDMIGHATDVLCESVGYLAKETKNYVLIVPHIHGEIRTGEARIAKASGTGDMAIPKSAIVKQTTLRKK